METLLKPPRNCTGDAYITPGTRDLPVQFALSLVLGLSAFLGFCILRPRWPTLYAARTRWLDPDVGLPALPDSFFGWIPRLYRITEEQVLASAGLDAFVFLRFFKLAIRLFFIMGFFATAVLLPINYSFADRTTPKPGKGKGDPAPSFSAPPGPSGPLFRAIISSKDDMTWNPDKGYLWAYLLFTYFFTALIIYSVNAETFRVIRVRQRYLGTQSTVTDRTFRLSGLPKKLRSEDEIRQLIERLEIGSVESVTLCRDWSKLDRLMEQRDAALRSLEAAWAKFRGREASVQAGTQANARPGHGRSGESSRSRPGSSSSDGETDRLLENGSPPRVVGRERPQFRIRYGPLRLRSRRVDAIDHYEEELQRLDRHVNQARNEDYPAATMAFVTMDSIAACQMAIQARIDPRPGQLLAKPAPAPTDIVWKNTYSRRSIRRLKGWSVTVFVTILTLLWLIPVAALAGLMSWCTIQGILPGVTEWLSGRPVMLSLVQTGLPTVTVSLLNVAVPYLYDWLSNGQGLISQGDVELAVISKNFFFTFFNIFLVFTVSGTATTFWASLRDVIKDTRLIPQTIAKYIPRLGLFYANFILLQGIGLMPFRLLQAGSVFLYPFLWYTSRTPRERAQLARPNVFQYGFYLPTALLVFILCTVYSVLRQGYIILIFGVVYFTLGYFIYKYQLLYSMVQPQHATGGAWPIICYRIILGVLVFQITMSGVLALEAAFVASVMVLPLLALTVWYSYYFRQRFEPLTRFIALRSIRVDEGGAAPGNAADDTAVVDDDDDEEGGYHIPLVRRATAALRRGSTVDEDRERGLRFENPNLIRRLEQPWIYNAPPPRVARDDSDSQSPRSAVHLPEAMTSEQHVASSQSSFSLGDTNVWRDVPAGGSN